MIMNLKRFVGKWIFLLKNIRGIKNSDILLLDTPVHRNLGDQAIAIAERSYLEEVLPKKKVFEIPANRIDGIENVISKIVSPEALITIHGGGFLGNLWEDEEYRFRRIVNAFPDNRVIVFPQTVTFDMETNEGKKFFEESYKVYSGHKNLKFFLREEKSYTFMKKNMKQVDSFLTPDIVTLLRVKVEDCNKNNQILLCLRNDIEKSLGDNDILIIKKNLDSRFSGFEIEFTDTVITDKNIKFIGEGERVKFVTDKIDEFRRAKLIITDRLHGMIFSLLAGTECIAFNNKNGKVGNVHKWLDSYKYIHMVNSMDEFIDIIGRISIDKINYYDNGALRNKFGELDKELTK